MCSVQCSVCSELDLHCCRRLCLQGGKVHTYYNYNHIHIYMVYIYIYYMCVCSLLLDNEKPGTYEIISCSMVLMSCRIFFSSPRDAMCVVFAVLKPGISWVYSILFTWIPRLACLPLAPNSCDAEAIWRSLPVPGPVAPGSDFHSEANHHVQAAAKKRSET